MNYMFQNNILELEDSQDCFEVLQKEIGFTDKNRPYTKMYTCGLLGCAAIAGYDANKKFGFLGHIDESIDPQGVLTVLNEKLKEYSVAIKDIAIYRGSQESETAKNLLDTLSTQYNTKIYDLRGIVPGVSLDVAEGATYAFEQARSYRHEQNPKDAILELFELRPI